MVISLLSITCSSSLGIAVIAQILECQRQSKEKERDRDRKRRRISCKRENDILYVFYIEVS